MDRLSKRGSVAAQVMTAARSSRRRPLHTEQEEHRAREWRLEQDPDGRDTPLKPESVFQFRPVGRHFYTSARSTGRGPRPELNGLGKWVHAAVQIARPPMKTLQKDDYRFSQQIS